MLVNAQLLAEGWNSPRATVCMHLAPTASKRIYQQRVGRVTRRHPGKEAGIVVDFVHPATKHDDPVVTLHSLLDRDVYRGGAIVVGPVRRGRGRRVRVERRVIPVTAEEDRRIEVFERELWRIAVEHLDYGEQVQWAALAGARVAPNGWRRARAMLHFDQGGELKRTFLLTAVERNQNAQLRLRALQEIAAAARRRGVRPRDRHRRVLAARREARGRQGHAPGAGREADRPPRPGQQLDLALREHDARGARGVRRAALAGDQAAARPARQLERRRPRPQRAPARPRRAPAGPAAQRRAARRRDPAHRRGRRGVNGARTRMSRKPAALARELLRNFPKAAARRSRRAAAQAQGRRRGRRAEGVLAVGGGRRSTASSWTPDRSTATSSGGRRAEAPKPRRSTRAGSTTESDPPLIARPPRPSRRGADAARGRAGAAEAAPPTRPSRARPRRGRRGRRAAGRGDQAARGARPGGRGAGSAEARDGAAGEGDREATREAGDAAPHDEEGGGGRGARGRRERRRGRVAAAGGAEGQARAAAARKRRRETGARGGATQRAPSFRAPAPRPRAEAAKSLGRDRPPRSTARAKAARPRRRRRRRPRRPPRPRRDERAARCVAGVPTQADEASSRDTAGAR